MNSEEPVPVPCPSCQGLGSSVYLHDGRHCPGRVRRYNYASLRRKKKILTRLREDAALIWRRYRDSVKS